MSMSEQQLEETLSEVIWFANDEEGIIDIEGIDSFDQAGILTMNKGLVLNMEDGSQFQLTIVKSR